MLIWINGTFRASKTQAAHELRRQLPGSVIADPEVLGFGIQRMYPQDIRTDFQNTRWWEPADTALRGSLFAPHIQTDDSPLPQVVEQIGKIIGHDIRYSARERLLLPLRMVIVKARHVR